MDDATHEDLDRLGSALATTSAPPTRRPLDSILILTEAISFIDEHGRERLTMRQLGARLGVEAMALYPYVPRR